MGHSWNEVLKAEHNREMEIRFHFSLDVTVCVLLDKKGEREVKCVVNGHSFLLSTIVLLYSDALNTDWHFNL